jgi:putative transposase
MSQEKPFHRRSIRLQGYDYTWDGAYFITICSHERQLLFGSIHEAKMTLNVYGQIVAQEWQKTPLLRPYVQLGLFVVMPNHLHGIIAIEHQALPASLTEPSPDSVGAQRAAPSTPHVPSQSLGAIIRAFKSAVTRRVRIEHDMSSTIWQRNYHEHIIRDEASYNQIVGYVENNPALWVQDRFFAE